MDETDNTKELLEDDYSQYKEPMAIFMADLFDRERSHIAKLASKKMDERRAQMDRIRASGRRSLSGSLAEALGMVPPLGASLGSGDRRKRIQALPEQEPMHEPRGRSRAGAGRGRRAGKKLGPVLVHPAKPKRGRGRPPGSKNKPKLPEGA